MRFNHCISRWGIIGLASLGFLVLGNSVFAQQAGDCSLSIGQSNLAEGVQSAGIDPLFLTDNQLIFVQKSLDTYCCRTQKLGASSCESKTIFSDDKNVIHSPHYLDHFLFLYTLYLRGDTSVCEEYGFDCSTRIDNEKGYPGKPVCFRFGEEGDPRCQSLYGVGSGVDILGASTDISSPGEYRALYEKFRTNTNSLTVPSTTAAKNGNPEEISIMHMGYYLCDEVDEIYSKVLNTKPTGDQSMTPIPGSAFQKCVTSIQRTYKSHGFDYVSLLAKAKGVDQMKQINTTSREHILDVMGDVKGTMNKLRTKMTAMLRKFPEFTNVCSQ